MKRSKLVLLAAIAVCASTGLATTSAWAAGPLWLVTGSRFDCAKATPGTYKSLTGCLGGPNAGSEEWERTTLTGTSGKLFADQGTSGSESNVNLGNFIFKSSAITIECATLDVSGTSVGGVPAKAYTLDSFKSCSVAGRSESECTVNGLGEASGSITVPTTVEVIYLGTEKEAEKEEGPLGDLLTPETGENFVELEVSGTNCPLFTRGVQEVKGSVIGEITPVNTMSTAGKQIFPSTAIKKGFRWIAKGKVQEVKAALKAFGVIETVQIGTADGETVNGEEGGVTNH
jgi:hypothetical protein